MPYPHRGNVLVWTTTETAYTKEVGDRRPLRFPKDVVTGNFRIARVARLSTRVHCLPQYFSLSLSFFLSSYTFICITPFAPRVGGDNIIPFCYSSVVQRVLSCFVHEDWSRLSDTYRVLCNSSRAGLLQRQCDGRQRR